MSRTIYLPELQRIHIKNYTLYPNGLDYTFDFIKGANLVLGGNGMGKTTFVNLIKYAILGNYKIGGFGGLRKPEFKPCSNDWKRGWGCW